MGPSGNLKPSRLASVDINNFIGTLLRGACINSSDCLSSGCLQQKGFRNRPHHMTHIFQLDQFATTSCQGWSNFDSSSWGHRHNDNPDQPKSSPPVASTLIVSKLIHLADGARPRGKSIGPVRRFHTCRNWGSQYDKECCPWCNFGLALLCSICVQRRLLYSRDYFGYLAVLPRFKFVTSQP